MYFCSKLSHVPSSLLRRSPAERGTFYLILETQILSDPRYSNNHRIWRTAENRLRWAELSKESSNGRNSEYSLRSPAEPRNKKSKHTEEAGT